MKVWRACIFPSEIDQFRLHRSPGHRVWVHARLVEKSERRSTVDLDIYAEDGEPVAQVRGLRASAWPAGARGRRWTISCMPTSGARPNAESVGSAGGAEHLAGLCRSRWRGRPAGAATPRRRRGIVS